MRAAVVALLLVVPLLATGCVDFDERPPVVLVRSEFEVVSGAGEPEVVFGAPCESARYALDPPAVTLTQYALPHRPDFVVLVDHGDSWRAFKNATRADAFSVTAVASASGGGAAEKLFGDLVSTRGSSTFGGALAPAGRFEARALPDVSWRDGGAWLGDERLHAGQPLVRTYAYDVPAGEGGALTLRQTVTATYLGRVPVAIEPAAPCP